jgi:CheY-like chemotaxis protein
MTHEAPPNEPIAPPAAARPDAGPTPATVLYIEDDTSNVMLVERLLLRRPAVRLLVALLGATGLELAVSEQPSLILVDMHLPDMTGETILGRLRDGPLTSHLPVVVLSGDTASHQQAKVLRDGAADYVTKPFELSRFFEIIDRYTQ